MHKFTHSTIEHHDDGSHTIHHQHADGPEHDVKHAVADLDEVHDSFEKHFRDPEEVEGMVGKKGIDPEKLEEAISPGIHEKMEEAVED